jgi:hypothetical protein
MIAMPAAGLLQRSLDWTNLTALGLNRRPRAPLLLRLAPVPPSASRGLDAIDLARKPRPAWLSQEWDTIPTPPSLPIRCLANRHIPWVAQIAKLRSVFHARPPSILDKGLVPWREALFRTSVLGRTNRHQ